MISYAVTISIECDACRVPNPVNGIVGAVRCARCDAVTKLDDETWKHIGGEMSLPNPEHGERNARSSQADRVRATRRAPGCHACGTELDTAGLPALAEAGRWRCPKCGVESRVRAARGLVLAFCPFAHFVVGEIADDGERKPVGAIEVPCPQCGAAVTTDGTSRDVTCRYCDTSSYLADDVWQRLHPVREQEFFLICADGEEIARIERERTAAALARAATDALTSAELEACARDPNDAMRLAIAGNPHASAHVLFTLAHDKQLAVRQAVARHPATSPKALAAMAAEQDLQKILIARADLPATVLKQLAHDGTNAVRALAVAHPAIDLATLQGLADDKKPVVRDAARSRLRELAASGVDVNAGRGLFAKLFDRW